MTDKISTTQRPGNLPRKAMVLAAGFGQRMRPLTDRIPKPMIPVMGRPLLDHVLDRVEQAGIAEAVVNTHHLHQIIEEHLARRATPQIHLSHEKEILETGGGIKQALPLLGDQPFFTASGKILWFDKNRPAFWRLADHWRDDDMDALLLLAPTVGAVGYDGPGDFTMDSAGRLRRRVERMVAPYVYTGIQLLHPRLFRDSPDGFFSINLLWDRAIAEGRLFGLRHEGAWFQASTPMQLTAIETHLARHGFASAD